MPLALRMSSGSVRACGVARAGEGGDLPPAPPPRPGSPTRAPGQARGSPARSTYPAGRGALPPRRHDGPIRGPAYRPAEPPHQDAQRRGLAVLARQTTGTGRRKLTTRPTPALHADGGTTPVWNERLPLQTNNELELFFDVFDDNMLTSDQMIGAGRCVVRPSFPSRPPGS